MNLSKALEQAQDLKPSQVSRGVSLYENIEWEMSLGQYSEEQYEQAEDALSLLEERIPGIRKKAHMRAESHIPQLSRVAKKNLYADQDEVGAARTEIPAVTATRIRTRRQRFQASRVPRFARRTVSQVDTAAGGWGSLVMTSIVTAAALAVLFLMLAGKGPTGVARLLRGASNLLNWVISPTIDPLNPPKAAIS